jgi:hypothetical protein
MVYRYLFETKNDNFVNAENKTKVKGGNKDGSRTINGEILKEYG